MPDINVNKLSEILNTKADIDLNNTGVFSTSGGGGVNLVQSTPSDAKGKEVASADFTLKQGGLELMDVVFAPLGIDESENKRRYLNGQVIIQSQFPAFTAAVKARMATMANAFTTEVNWQAEKTNSKLGQCGKFVIDDTAGTIRLPCVVNAQGLADLSLIGGIKNESLPNLKGTEPSGSYNETHYSGVFKMAKSISANSSPNSGGQTPVVEFDASVYSSAYQDNAPVQQEAVQYPYCIQVATSVEETLPAIREYQLNNPFFFGQSMWSDVDPNNASWLISAGQWNAKATYLDYYDWLVEQINAGIKGFKGNIGYAWKSQTADIRFWTAIRNPSVGCAVYGGYGIPFKGTVTAINPDGTLTFYEDSTGITYENLVYTESENINIEGTAFDNLKFANDYDFVVNQTDQTFRLPLKTKLASGSAVAGNGMSLGISTGSNDEAYKLAGLRVGDGATSGVVLTAPDYYGVEVGTKPASISSPATGAAAGVTTDPTKSGIETSSNGLKLYFYVGDTVQDASVINTGSILNDVANLKARRYVTEAYHNGTEWYRIWSDGWIEQGGVANAGGTVTVTFLKAFKDTNYMVVATTLGTSGEIYAQSINKTSGTAMTFYNYGGSTNYKKSWYACGQGA